MLSRRNSVVWVLLVVFLVGASCDAFQVPAVSKRPTTAFWMAKKKSKSAGKGFGSPTAPVPSPPKRGSDDQQESSGEGGISFQSIETGGSDAIPTIEVEQEPALEMDKSLPAEERAERLLREKYGMKTLEEQRRDQKRRENREQLADWKAKADEGQDFDLIAALPEPLVIFIDRFLKIGVTISTLLFVAAGIGITLEAWSATSGDPLPEDIDNFIVNTVEPNFTPGLLVLLTFSISLGLFASAQLGSEASVYSEDKK